MTANLKQKAFLAVLTLAVILVSGCATQKETKTYGPFTTNCELPDGSRCSTTSDCTKSCQVFCVYITGSDQAGGASCGGYQCDGLASATGYKEGLFDIKCQCSCFG